MDIIYHITTADEWKTGQEKCEYEAVSLKEEGFIHCSQQEQLPGVLVRYFAGQTNLVKLAIDPKKLKSRLIYEWSPTLTDTFPHVYGPINTDAVISAESIQ